MDLAYILLSIGAVLLIYQLGFRRDNDALDDYGYPVKRKKGWFS